MAQVREEPTKFSHSEKSPTDQINRDPTDNRWVNLRELDVTMNNWNSLREGMVLMTTH